MASQQKASLTSVSHRPYKTACSAGVAGMSIVAGLSKESEVVGVLRVIWNDLLSFINCYRHQLDTDILRQAAPRF